jgi:hypothetical protein
MHDGVLYTVVYLILISYGKLMLFDSRKYEYMYFATSSKL